MLIPGRRSRKEGTLGPGRRGLFEGPQADQIPLRFLQSGDLSSHRGRLSEERRHEKGGQLRGSGGGLGARPKEIGPGLRRGGMSLTFVRTTDPQRVASALAAYYASAERPGPVEAAAEAELRLRGWE